MNRWWTGLALILLDTLFTSAAHVSLKMAAMRIEVLDVTALLEPWLWLGLVLQVLMLPVALLAYRYGDVVVFFPLMSLSHVWNTIAGTAWLGEQLTVERGAGTALILVGSMVLGWPAKAATP